MQVGARMTDSQIDEAIRNICSHWNNDEDDIARAAFRTKLTTARIEALREAKACIVPDGKPALAAARIQKLIDEEIK